MQMFRKFFTLFKSTSRDSEEFFVFSWVYREQRARPKQRRPRQNPSLPNSACDPRLYRLLDDLNNFNQIIRIFEIWKMHASTRAPRAKKTHVQWLHARARTLSYPDSYWRKSGIPNAQPGWVSPGVKMFILPSKNRIFFFKSLKLIKNIN